MALEQAINIKVEHQVAIHRWRNSQLMPPRLLNNKRGEKHLLKHLPRGY